MCCFHSRLIHFGKKPQNGICFTDLEIAVRRVDLLLFFSKNLFKSASTPVWRFVRLLSIRVTLTNVCTTLPCAHKWLQIMRKKLLRSIEYDGKMSNEAQLSKFRRQIIDNVFCYLIVLRFKPSKTLDLCKSQKHSISSLSNIQTFTYCIPTTISQNRQISTFLSPPNEWLTAPEKLQKHCQIVWMNNVAFLLTRANDDGWLWNVIRWSFLTQCVFVVVFSLCASN